MDRRFNTFVTSHKVPLVNFKSIEEARLELENCSFQSFFMEITALEGRPNTEIVGGEQWQTIFDFSLGQNRQMLTVERQQQQDMIRSAHVVAGHARSWLAKSNDLWRTVQSSQGRDRHRMAGLRVVAICTWLRGLGLAQTQTIFDEHLCDFQEIVLLVKGIMDFWDGEGKDPQYGEIDTGVGRALGFVAFRCRHSKTREEAIDLLRRANRMEGLWDGRIAATISQCVKVREEKAGVKDFMLEDARIAPTAAWVNWKERLLRLRWQLCKPTSETAEEEIVVGF